MSLKPPKKSDVSKHWMNPRKSKEILIQPEYHLIVTEGTDTEPQYFESIKTRINSKYQGKIYLEIYGEGDNTLSLLKKAQKRALGSSTIFKHVWIVFDTDDFPPDHINRTVEKCLSMTNEETEYHALWSNQCVELWFMLHFNYIDADLHRSEYFPKLTEWMSNIGCGKYEKNRKDMFDILMPYLDNAIDNAKKLNAINKNKTPANSSPGTQVYKLLELLKPYLK
ncbi:MAG: RloB domain-containing protein [Ruminiclostridium sp.]|nr:RloB domain-containing protein [Ruminiclostridium sp.]